MERAMGIEPTSPAWKTGALPLSYARSVPPGGTPRTTPGGVPQGRRGECTEAKTRVNDGQNRLAAVSAPNRALTGGQGSTGSLLVLVPRSSRRCVEERGRGT